MKFILTAFVILLVGLSGPVMAREAMDMSLDETVTTTGSDAKQMAFDQATEEATLRLTRQLLGPSKTDQNWSTLKDKILKNSARYVLFIKGSTPLVDKETSRVTVQLRLSPDNLEALLREVGAYASGTIRLLPLIRVSEGRGSKYAWWAVMNESGGLSEKYFKRIFQHVNAYFKGKSIYVQDPSSASFRMSVPTVYRIESLRREDQSLLAEYLKADVVLSGNIILNKARSDSTEQTLTYQLQLWQAKNGRLVSEVARSQTVPSDTPKVVIAVIDQMDKTIFKDLASRLSDEIGSGNLNLNVVQLAIEGRLSYQQQNDLKRQLGDIREVRSVKERLFEPSRVTYEVETPASVEDLAKSLQASHWRGLALSLQSTQDQRLVLSAHATSAQ